MTHHEALSPKGPTHGHPPVSRDNWRDQLAQDRQGHRDSVLEHRRQFTRQDQAQVCSIGKVLTRLNSHHFQNREDLIALKRTLSEGQDSPDEFFTDFGAVHSLVGVLNASNAGLEVLALHCIANLAPLSEKNGLTLARSAGPYLITLLASSSHQLQEGAGVALGNLALSGPKVVKVLNNQEVIESLLPVLESRLENVQGAGFYALYHVLHAGLIPSSSQHGRMIEACKRSMGLKAPVEVFWVLFVLSCDSNLHIELAHNTVISRALDVCTYEIFQKSDSRPLVKIVTPIVRILANLCAGPRSENACLAVLRHSDLPAILMALLGTNFTHLCKETLWWFGNLVNSDSVEVQEELIDLEIMDRMEYHTVQAIRRLDPFQTHVIA
ncbi:hypothetical protein TCAL_09255 [Tigriopus californicus]|uniref:Armadillo repeat-containing domain-containing protein n=1 Tax=Tigriopus californicus TaxID=6832 RepID=A0A553N9A6_TIGCA|nr:uncharacterized protein LOC131884547 [Tigriopus californicus]TRY62034.1 hypothetical protein TCAL_09255 [Tigriopus californicus]|eukprot:TCALIF_09255-PA protein Name:"Similar to Os01g0253300 Importin subunit alpha-1a (Oryza sativa subsp. japonica)" AED:0.48 eAED:0.48 QI:0/-1/0/1/-1/1/1/0/381